MKLRDEFAACMPTDSFLSSFFWNSKVTSTRSAEANAGQECEETEIFDFEDLGAFALVACRS